MFCRRTSQFTGGAALGHLRTPRCRDGPPRQVQRLVRRHHGGLLRLLHVPELDRLVCASSGQELAIWAERQARNAASVSFEGGKFLPPGTSQRLMVPSSHPEASALPSG